MMAQTTPPTPAPQQTDSKSDAKTSTPSASATNALPEMKTTTFKGVLVDMSCASGASAGASAAQPGDSAKAPAPDQSNTANRSASDSGASCPVSANSTTLGMKMDDGKILRFDLVGNQRAQDALKNDKRWSKDLSANKPIRATVSGVMSGDKLVVSSIH
jgi:hypothetical protein